MAPAARPRPRKKPLLRGYSHEVASYAAIAAAGALVAGARSGSARLAAGTYAITLVLLFAASAFYHRPHWSPRARSILGRVDQSAIFLLIAGTNTPIALAVGGAVGHAVLAAVWAGAVCGVALSIAWPSAPKWVMALVCVGIGWIGAVAAPALYARLGARALLLMIGGGLLYTIGAAIYAARRPDPAPRIFGYHEIFHLLVVAAAACHFVVVQQAVDALS